MLPPHARVDTAWGGDKDARDLSAVTRACHVHKVLIHVQGDGVGRLALWDGLGGLLKLHHLV